MLLLDFFFEFFIAMKKVDDNTYPWRDLSFYRCNFFKKIKFKLFVAW